MEAERDGDVGLFVGNGCTSNSSGASSEDKSTVVNKLSDDHSPMNQPHDQTASDDIQEVADHDHNNKKSSDDHATHLWTERQRRKKMKTMFHYLHALLPQLPPKAEMSTIVDEAISYIKTLQQTLQNLEMQKLEKLNNSSSSRQSFLADHGSSSTCTHFDIISADHHPFSKIFPIVWCSPIVFRTWTSSNLTLNVCGRDAHISICSSRKPGLLTAICLVFEKHNLEIVSAHISSDQYKSMLMIHVRVNVGDELMKIFPYDEVYKLAALEIMLWVNSK